jgi:predicted DNA binding CopG/RHH family protein
MTEEGIDKISLVETPAIGVEFVTLAKQQVFKETKRGILLGAALIPDKPIYRMSDDGKEYYGYFSKDTVRSIAERYMEMKRQDVWNVDHADDVTGVVMLESWIVEGENDKSKNYGFDVPEGTWMISVKVNNEELKKEILETNRIKGFSIEGAFELRQVEQQLTARVQERLCEEIKKRVAEKLEKMLS